MDNYLKIHDLVTFNFLNPELITIKDDFESANGPFKKITDVDMSKVGLKGLGVRIAATHSGVITMNNMFYLPDKMKKGTSTFLQDYGKPILLHHNEKQDNIGRVIDAVYVDTSNVIRDVVKDSSFSDSSLKDFCEGKMPFSYQVDFARKYLIKDSQAMIENDVYRGLGHIQIIADITDPDAIPKFLDGRYLTGSVGARTNKAICSICKQNWTEEGQCNHSPGEVEDGKKCVLIAGDFFYDEYSMVNGPADRQSKVLELYYNGNIKNIEVKNEFVGNIYEVGLSFPQYSKEEKMDEAANKTEVIKDSVKDFAEEKVDEKEEEVIEDFVCEQRTLSELIDILDSDADFSDENRESLYEMVYRDNLVEVDWDKVADEMEKYACGLEGEDVVLDGFEDAAKKPQDRPGGSNAGKYKTGPFCGPSGGAPKGTYPVNTLKRAKAALAYARNAPNPAGIRKCVCRHWGKQLPSCQSKSKDFADIPKSAFCGPNKTFPVRNAEDVGFIHSALKSFRDKEVVKSILKNVERKAKAFGYIKRTKDAIAHARVLQMLTQTLSEHMYEKKYRENEGKEPVLTEDDVSALTTVMKNLVGMVGKDNFVSVLSSGEQELKDVVKYFQDVDLLDEIISLENALGEVRDSLSEIEEERDALKQEYDIIQKENDAIRDELIESKKNLKDLKVEKMSILTLLKDGELSEEKKKEWVSLNDEVLGTSLNKLEEEVDIKKMADKLNDGTSKNPEGEVEDPTLTFESMPEDIQSEIDKIRNQAISDFDNVREGIAWANHKISLLLQNNKDWKNR